jgi:hypothetical protein
MPCPLQTEILHHSQACLITRQELKFLRHSSSPLKWTKVFIQSSKDDFSYETMVLYSRATRGYLHLELFNCA